MPKKFPMRIGNTVLYVKTVQLNIVYQDNHLRIIEIDGLYLATTRCCNCPFTEICFSSQDDAIDYLELHGIERKTLTQNLTKNYMTTPLHGAARQCTVCKKIHDTVAQDRIHGGIVVALDSCASCLAEKGCLQ